MKRCSLQIDRDLPLNCYRFVINCYLFDIYNGNLDGILGTR